MCAHEPGLVRIKDGIRQTIFRQMGPDADLGEVDMETMVALSKIHGLAFQKACEHLRPGVRNIVGYIRSLLDLPRVQRFWSTSATPPLRGAGVPVANDAAGSWAPFYDQPPLQVRVD